MKPLISLIAVLAAAGMGFLAGTQVAGGEDPAASRAAPAEVGSDVELRAQVRELRRELSRVREGSEAPSRLTAAGDGREAAPGTSPESGVAGASSGEALAKGPRYFATLYEGVLAEIDWPKLGRHAAEITPIVRDIATGLLAGAEPTGKNLGRIAELNQALVQAALSLQDKVPGFGMNGKFADPAFQANLLASTLESMELPLSPPQEERLEVLTRDYLARDEVRRQAYDERTFEVEKLAGEAAAREEYFREVYALLTAEQAVTLGPEEMRGRVRLDMFSGAVLYDFRVGVLPFARAPEIGDGLTQWLASKVQFTGDVRVRAGEIVGEWISGLPPALLDEESSVLDLKGLVTCARANAWAVRYHDLYRRLGAEPGLTEEQVERIRRLGGFLIPMRT